MATSAAIVYDNNLNTVNYDGGINKLGETLLNYWNGDDSADEIVNGGSEIKSIDGDVISRFYQLGGKYPIKIDQNSLWGDESKIHNILSETGSDYLYLWDSGEGAWNVYDRDAGGLTELGLILEESFQLKQLIKSMVEEELKH